MTKVALGDALKVGDAAGADDGDEGAVRGVAVAVPELKFAVGAGAEVGVGRF